MHRLRRRNLSSARQFMGAAGLLLSLAAPQLASAQVPDGANDFLGTYAGPKGDDLDIRSAQAFFDGRKFLFSSTQGGAVGTTPGGIYVWGINRGDGRSPGGVFAPGTLFDAVAILNPAGGSVIRDLRAGTVNPLLDVFFGGNTAMGSVDLSFLSTLGFDPASYEVNLWTRNGPTTDPTIADFANDAGNFAVTVTPEPGTSTLALAGLLAMGAVLRRRRRNS